MRFFTAAAVLLGAAVANAVTYTNCGTSSDIGTVTAVTISPDPPVSGQTTTITATAVLNSPVTGGTIKATASLGLFSFSNTYDVCVLGQQANDPCPLGVGAHTLSFKQDVPAGISGATIGFKVTGVTSSGQSVFCVKGTTKVN
ncbi:hypothetical protein GQ42DRAFT_166123 [Ramicandelaber brevisporus]|nr:hypothetical protein GQ42DRAFT_166123 [Ramicandelaber brevisporus]